MALMGQMVLMALMVYLNSFDILAADFLSIILNAGINEFGYLTPMLAKKDLEL